MGPQAGGPRPVKVTGPAHSETGNAPAAVEGLSVLLTGAGGFIGSHLAERLVTQGARVTCLVHYNSLSSLGNLAHVDPEIRRELRIEFGNIEDGDHMIRLAEGQDAVVHLAALIGIPFSYVSPRSYVKTNVEGTLNLLEAVRRCAAGRLVHTSTSEVYGTAQRSPIDEDHPLKGQSPYAASKIAADKLAEAYALSFGLPVVTLRPFNTYGPRQSARGVVPATIIQALRRDAVALGSLHPVRDMTYVADTVDGFLRAVAADGILGETINLGSGEAKSVGELAELILGIMDLRQPIEHDAARARPAASEVLNLVCDNGKAARLLGWRPRVSLERGLRLTIDQIRQNPQAYDADRYAI
jgi:NAD dependent epimerase/dehydratase